MQTLTYKTFHGSTEYSTDDRCHHGKILFIQDLVTYESETLPELEKAFHAAVDDYLVTCVEVGKDPEDIHDLRLLREAQAESYGQPMVSLEDVKKSLKD
jgi:predicted HicB family RNase H-like nuclease